MHIKEVFDNLRKDSPAVFFIRHAKRFSTPNIEDDYKCTLTPEGKVDAGVLGQLFAERIGQVGKIVSSPVGRCLETANSIMEGNKNSIDIGQWPDLERAYAFEPKLAIEHFKKFPVRTVIKKLFSGESLEGIRSTDEGTILLLKNILSDLIGENKISVYVSHDSVLAMFFATLTGIPIYDHEELWFTYLDGMCLQLNENNEVILYRGSDVYSISNKLYSLGLQNQVDGTLILENNTPDTNVGDASASRQPYWDGVFSNIKNDLPTAFILRHAERFYTNDPNKDHACELTEKGKEDAKQLGQTFHQQIGKFTQVLSSPADRCVETGRKIIEGNQNQLPVLNSKYLAEAYVFDGRQAVVNFQKLEVMGVIQRLIAGDSLIGMRSKEEGTKLLLSTILPSLQSKEVSLYVTHDAVVGTFLGTLMEGHSYENADLEFRFLDGVCLQRENTGEIILYRQGKAYNIAKQIEHLQSTSQGDIALIFFMLKDIIENAQLINYFISDIVYPLISPIIPNGLNKTGASLEVLQGNYMMAGAHLTCGLAAAYFFPMKGISYVTKVSVPLTNSAVYLARIELLEYFKKLQSHDELNPSINSTTDFLSKCSEDIVMYSLLGAFNAMATKFLIPNLGSSIITFGIFNNAVIGSLQCYANSKESVLENSGYADVTIPYLIDIAYIGINMQYNSFWSFSSFYEGFHTLKKSVALLSGLVAADYLTKLTLAILPNEVKEQYVDPPFEYIHENCNKMVTYPHAIFEEGMELISNYFAYAEPQEEL